jgi:hypothetical protein
MKAISFLSAFAALSCISQASFAATADEVISNLEQNRNVSCRYLRSSSMQYCFNTVCEHSEYYSCGEQRVVLKVRRIQYPDGSVNEKVTDTAIGGF